MIHFTYRCGIEVLLNISILKVQSLRSNHLPNILEYPVMLSIMTCYNSKGYVAYLSHIFHRIKALKEQRRLSWNESLKRGLLEILLAHILL
jgi:hypothetical protein